MFSRFLLAIAGLTVFCAAVIAQPQPKPRGQASFAEALAAAKQRDWARVARFRDRIDNAAARDVIDWYRLRGQQGSFAECRAFLSRNPDWPGLPLLRQRCEYAIPRSADSAEVLEYFEAQPPRTGTGSLRLAAALMQSGREAEGAREVQRGWQTHILSGAEHSAYITRNPISIRELHEARLDMLLWRGAEAQARRMFPLVSEGWQKLAEARMALRNSENGVDALIEAVPEALRSDPGLAYERFRWRIRRDRYASAIELMLARSGEAADLGRADLWADWRDWLARRLLRGGDAERAYRVASTHGLTEGSDFAQLEWLSGYIALRHLKEPERALTHFDKFRLSVVTPISLGRAGYWIGRAHEALGNAEAAEAAYRFAAGYQSSFYGQLAAERAGLPADVSMTGRSNVPDWRGQPFTRSRVFEAALQLYLVRDRDLMERFLVHLGESQSRDGLAQLADLALELKEPHIALRIAKEAARQGHEIWKPYFPLALPTGLDLPVPQEWALAIARRESEFDPVVVSPAGARGLMQLMPRTAQSVAQRIGETYSTPRLTSDSRYNARLGSSYLATLNARFRGNPVLMSVGYNAGPGRANAWIEQLGDPRGPGVDIVDWIEAIPFRETRNYVMRVTESLAPYRARLTGEVPEPMLSRELTR